MSRSARFALALVATAVVGIVALLAAGGRLPNPGGQGSHAAGAAVVLRVVDGDTLVVDVGGTEERIRLIGIDTPESVAPGRPVECFGAEASDHLAELVPPRTPVRLERDVEARDAYDRMLAYVYRADDGLFVNRVLVEGGFAEASEYPPNTTHRPELDGAERAARASRIGLWGVCGGPDVAVGPPPAPG